MREYIESVLTANPNKMLERGNKMEAGMYKDIPKPVGPLNTVVKESGPAKLLALLSLLFVWIGISTTMTVVGFIANKVNDGESLMTLLSWWYSLMEKEVFLTMVFPSVFCAGMFIMIMRPGRGEKNETIN